MEETKITISLDPSQLVDLLRKYRKPIDPPEAGIYLLFCGEEVVYVGRSSHVRERVEQHRGTKEFDSFAMVPVEEEAQTWVEKSLIQALKPKYNKVSLEPCKPFRQRVA